MELPLNGSLLLRLQVIGLTIIAMATGSIFIRTVTFTTASGRTTNVMASERMSFQRLEKSCSVSGRTVNATDTLKSFELTISSWADAKTTRLDMVLIDIDCFSVVTKSLSSLSIFFVLNSIEDTCIWLYLKFFPHADGSKYKNAFYQSSDIISSYTHASH